jgi:hypothetical protein
VGTLLVVDASDHRLAQVLDQIEHRLAAMRVFLAGNSMMLGEFSDVGER